MVANPSSVLSCCFLVRLRSLCIVKCHVISAPCFHGEVVCPALKDLVCLFELPLIPMLHQYEQSAVAEVFPTRIPYSIAQFT